MIGVASAATKQALRLPQIASSGLRKHLCAALLVGASIHLALVPDHWPTTFAALSALAGLMQLALAIGVWRDVDRRVYPAIATLSLVLLQLYSLDVTIGLPPAIAHAHIAGTHVVLGLTMSWPNTVDLQGVVAVTSEVIAVVTSWRMQDAGGRGRALVSPAG